MRPRALLALALCGGCYPWVGGRWADYSDPETVQLVGAAVTTERLGGYWADDSPEASIWWGWLGAPVEGMSALDMVAPGGPGCTRGEPSELVFTDLLADPGATVSLVRGPDDYELPFDDTALRFEAITDTLAAGSYSLDPVLSDDGGLLEADPLLSVPPGINFDSPPLAAQTVMDGTLDDLVFSWEPSTGAADWVFVEARISGLTSSGYSPYEWAVCIVPFEDGQLTVAPALWSDPDQAEAVYLFMGTIDERLEPVGDRDFSASTVGVRRSVGILRL